MRDTLKDVVAWMKGKLAHRELARPVLEPEVFRDSEVFLIHQPAQTQLDRYRDLATSSTGDHFSIGKADLPREIRSSPPPLPVDPGLERDWRNVWRGMEGEEEDDDAAASPEGGSGASPTAAGEELFTPRRGEEEARLEADEQERRDTREAPPPPGPSVPEARVRGWNSISGSRWANWTAAPSVLAPYHMAGDRPAQTPPAAASTEALFHARRDGSGTPRAEALEAARGYREPQSGEPAGAAEEMGGASGVGGSSSSSSAPLPAALPNTSNGAGATANFSRAQEARHLDEEEAHT